MTDEQDRAEILKSVYGSHPVYQSYLVPEDGHHRVYTVDKNTGEVVQTRKVRGMSPVEGRLEAIATDQLPDSVRHKA